MNVEGLKCPVVRENESINHDDGMILGTESEDTPDFYIKYVVTNEDGMI